jgi:pyruvate dehydrogenase E1 component beta subunit
VIREGDDLTIAATSYMTLETLRAAEILAEEGVSAEVIDIRTLKPLDDSSILDSVRKTGHLIVADTGWRTFGVGAEIVARVTEEAFSDLKSPPRRVALPDCPTPTTPALANHYYPRAVHIAAMAKRMLGLGGDDSIPHPTTFVPLDVPDLSFKGPF